MMDSITRALATYAIGAAETDFPARARRYAVDAITDCIGCMLAGAREPLAPMVLSVVGGTPGGAERAVLVGTDLAAAAALHFGIDSANIALAYESSSGISRSHAFLRAPQRGAGRARARLSTITCCPRLSVSFCPRMRAFTSTLPPAANRSIRRWLRCRAMRPAQLRGRQMPTQRRAAGGGLRGRAISCQRSFPFVKTATVRCGKRRA